MQSFGIIFLRCLPLRFLSRIVGYVARIPLPAVIMRMFMKWYIKKYNVAIDEAFMPPGGFKTIDEFFTRKLKRGLRSIDLHPLSLVSPVDARVSAYGSIHYGKLIQAKGILYDVASLIPGEFQSRFIGGSFITLYLSPGDYHRIHSPVHGAILGYQYNPGKLYTVQDWLVRALPGLFTVNERITTFIQTEFGLVAVCKIGALNVGNITLSYCNEHTNKWIRKPLNKFFDKKIPIAKGDELGVFHLGSTVIIITQKPLHFVDIEEKKVMMGQVLGYFTV